MEIFNGFSEVFDLADKEFYTPFFSGRKRRKRQPANRPALPRRQIPEYIKQLQLLRRRAGIRQQTVASRMGSSQSSISRFEMGLVNPTVNFLNRYGEVIGIEIGISFRDKTKKSS